jgi:hypothetical protein
VRARDEFKNIFLHTGVGLLSGSLELHCVGCIKRMVHFLPTRDEEGGKTGLHDRFDGLGDWHWLARSRIH